MRGDIIEDFAREVEESSQKIIPSREFKKFFESIMVRRTELMQSLSSALNLSHLFKKIQPNR